MKLESINLLEVKTNEGFLDILDLDDVDKIVCINDYMKFGSVRLKNGLVRCLTPESTREVKKCLEQK